jgi:UDP-3-O-[3-hydroxymyristoyl] glucosamine N-acyltransferase
MLRNRFFDVLQNITISELAKSIDCKTHNNLPDYNNTPILNIKNIDDASEGDLTFLSNKKYVSKLDIIKASVCIVGSDISIPKLNQHTCFIISDNPYYSYSKALNFLYKQKISNSKEYISTSSKIGNNVKIGLGTIIEDNCEIGDDVFIGSNIVIKQGCIIGNGTKIFDQAYLSFCSIGNNCIIHPGARIGTDGFGFATHNGAHHKILHVGSVVIEDNVEVGANSCIDRGSIKDTIISSGSIIDNLVQIGHNVELGNGCIIVSQVGIAGSTKLGNYVAVGGQAGISGHLEISDMVQIAGKSGVIKNIDKASTVGGYPAIPIKDWHKQNIILRKMLNDK